MIQKMTEGAIVEDSVMHEDDIKQLKITIGNLEYEVKRLSSVIFKLTGCSDFGHLDGMNGNCVICSHEDKELFDKCWRFKFGEG